MQADPASTRAMTMPAPGQRRHRTPWLPLLSAVLALGKGQAQLIRHTERAWASVTFSGTRHAIALAFTGAQAVTAGEELIATLADHEFTIPRQLVADAVVVRADHAVLPEPRLEVEVELLLLEEG